MNEDTRPVDLRLYFIRHANGEGLVIMTVAELNTFIRRCQRWRVLFDVEVVL